MIACRNFENEAQKGKVKKRVVELERMTLLDFSPRRAKRRKTAQFDFFKKRVTPLTRNPTKSRRPPKGFATPTSSDY